MPRSEPSWTLLSILPHQNPDMLSPRLMNSSDPAQETDSWRSGSIGGNSDVFDEHVLLASTAGRRKERKRLLFVGIIIARYPTYFRYRQS